MFDPTPTPIRTVCQIMLAALVVGLGGCGSFDQATQGVSSMLPLYRPEVVQGNFVSKEQAALLQPGMTRLQVRDTLGTPLLSSVFHGNRWDYVFTLKRQGIEEQSFRLTVFFKDDVLERFEGGDEMPSETEFVERISRQRDFKVPELEATEAQLAKFPLTAADAPLEAASEPAPAGAYPPLDPVASQ
jgi:outer membrane protein assembly factor BamE